MPKYPRLDVRAVDDFSRNNFFIWRSIHLVLFNKPRIAIYDSFFEVLICGRV
jgi:hypothetical protein